MNVRFQHPRSIFLCCLALWPLLMMSTNCRPELEEKTSVRLGYINEFCRVNGDCFDPLVCEDNACQMLNTPGDISCADMCDRLVSECGRSEDDCEGSCRKTIDGWSAEAINVFGQCTLGNTTPPLTCALATEAEAPSFCYRQIPLDQARQLRCDTFVDQARTYANGATESQLTQLRQECYIIARTSPPAVWAETDKCDETAIMLTGSEVIACYNARFSKVDPPLRAAP